jgi:preprotein translocase subunit SecG
MIFIVLIQESKGGGLASNFATYNQIGGVRKTTDFIVKATAYLAAFMVVASILSAHFAPKATNSDTILEGIETPAANLPGFNASQPQEAAPTVEAAPVQNTKENAQ